MAKSLFDCGEYQRAAEALKNSPTAPWAGSGGSSSGGVRVNGGVGGETVGTPGWRKSLFLRSYALFLAGAEDVWFHIWDHHNFLGIISISKSHTCASTVMV
jgi:hypothetical protein